MNTGCLETIAKDMGTYFSLQKKFRGLVLIWVLYFGYCNHSFPYIFIKTLMIILFLPFLLAFSIAEICISSIYGTISLILTPVLLIPILSSIINFILFAVLLPFYLILKLIYFVSYIPIMFLDYRYSN